jgi:hypothetical protein
MSRLIGPGRGNDFARYDSGTAFPPLRVDGDLFFRTDLDEVFYWDAGRSKWLSVGYETADFAYLFSVTNGMSYIDAYQCVVNVYGYSYPWDMQLVGFRCNVQASSSCTFAAYLGATLGPTLALSAATKGSATNWNATLTAGTTLTLFILNTATNAHNAQILLRRTAT